MHADLAPATHRVIQAAVKANVLKVLFRIETFGHPLGNCCCCCCGKLAFADCLLNSSCRPSNRCSFRRFLRRWAVSDLSIESIALPIELKRQSANDT